MPSVSLDPEQSPLLHHASSTEPEQISKSSAATLPPAILPIAYSKTILVCLLVLAVSVPLSNAACFLQPLEPGETDGCRDADGELHKFGSSWRDADCNDCTCDEIGMNCCSSYVTPVDYDTEKCESIFNQEACTYKVVEKDDHSKECPVHSWVG
ncbi:beta-microseminoprotein-like [Apus apus]|uniref:beta-microseminoprotein-like n=1 Tax=Apus apus TaxID=8895 RepID=UPI0021F81A5C|nr:beta-microseminoprotein-like [Apus apus]